MVSLNRIIVFLYSDCYKYNIYETNYIQKFSISSLLIVLQCFTLFLQEKFGPYFFIPRLFKPKPFNYRAISPEPGTECLICRDIIIPVDDSAVTPCHHAFHMECLSRWMEEKQQCPLCRAQIPPIINVID